MKKYLNLYKSKFCSLLWMLLGLEALVVIYLLTPEPIDPLIVIEPNFASLYGDNLLYEEGKPAIYTVSVSKNLDKELRVDLRYGGGAKRGVDYIAPDFVVIKQGDMNTTFEISALDDNEVEGEEQFSVKIAQISGKNFMEPLRPQDLGGVVFTKLLDEPKHQRKAHLPAVVSLMCAPLLVESNATLSCTLKTSQKSYEPLKVGLEFTGSAAYGVDYTAPEEVTIPVGGTSVAFDVTAIDDAYLESKETIDVKIISVSGGGFEENSIDSKTATITITDEKTSTQYTELTVNNIEQIEEGGSGTYILSLSREPLSDVVVTMKRNKSATKFNVPEQVIFHKGERSKTFKIETIDDNIKEKTDFIDFAIAKVEQESFEQLSYSNSAVKTKVVDEAVPTEADSETAYLSVKTENDKNTFDERAGDVAIVVTSSQPLLKDTLIRLKLEKISSQGRVYHLDKRVMIKAGASSATTLLHITDNNVIQPEDHFKIYIDKHDNGGLENLRSKDGITLRVFDDNSGEMGVKMALTCPDKLYENDKSIVCKLTMTQRAAEEVGVTLNYAGTATIGEDYDALETLTFGKGKKELMFKIKSRDDILKEGSESILPRVASVKQNYFERLEIVDNNQSIALIDEKRPTKTVYMKLKVSKAVQEGEVSPVTLTLSESAQDDVTVYLKMPLSDDYNDVKRVVIPKGSKEFTFDVTTIDDNLVEKNDYIEVTIGSVEQAGFEKLSFDKRLHRVKINDEKAPEQADDETAYISLHIDSDSVSEDAKRAKIIAALSQKAEKNMTLNLAYIGEAQKNIDFKANETITIKKGAIEGHTYLYPVNDNLLEGGEAISVDVIKHGNGGLEDVRVKVPLTFSLVDEKESAHSPKATVILRGPSKVSEPDLSKPYTVKIDQKTNADMVVTLTYTGSADSSDYKAISAVTIPKGKQSASFKIQTLDDNLTEDLESFSVAISKVEGGGLEHVVALPNAVKTLLSDEIDIAKEFERIVSTQVIEFDLGSRDVSEKSKKPLDKIAALLKRYTKAKIIIQGHTNSLGNEAFNHRLSQDRAVNIREYLVKQGVSKRRIKAIGYGSSRPLLSIDHPNALEFNKRVEFKVVY